MNGKIMETYMTCNMMIPNACSILEVSSLMEHMNEEQITVT